jgi:hypothetical protein
MCSNLTADKQLYLQKKKNHILQKCFYFVWSTSCLYKIRIRLFALGRAVFKTWNLQ